MKNLKLIIPFLIIFLKSFSQDSTKYLPQIQSGTVFQYNFIGNDGGRLVVDGVMQSVEKGGLTLVDTLKFGGKSEIYKIVISKKGMENASKLRAPKEQPTSTVRNFTLYVLSDDKTDYCFSRKFFKTLLEQKTAVYGGITYNLLPQGQEPPFEIDGKKFDAVDMISANGKKKFKLLNDPIYPLILSSTSNNIHAVLTKISGVD